MQTVRRCVFQYLLYLSRTFLLICHFLSLSWYTVLGSFFFFSSNVISQDMQCFLYLYHIFILCIWPYHFCNKTCHKFGSLVKAFGCTHSLKHLSCILASWWLHPIKKARLTQPKRFYQNTFCYKESPFFSRCLVDNFNKTPCWTSWLLPRGILQWNICKSLI